MRLPLALLAVLAATGLAFAQTEETNGDAQDGDPKPELTEEQKELDAQLLGRWGLVTQDLAEPLGRSLLINAERRCRLPLRPSRLDVQPGAVTDLPEGTPRTGTLIYWRTKAGLQRLDGRTGRLFVLPEIERAKRRQRIVWRVFGKFASYRMTFETPFPTVPRAVLMLEETVLYLKCPPAEGEAGE